jgi:hypothetical protein
MTDYLNIIKNSVKFSCNAILQYSNRTKLQPNYSFDETIKMLTEDFAKFNKIYEKTLSELDQTHKEIIGSHYRRLVFILSNKTTPIQEIYNELFSNQTLSSMKFTICSFIISYLYLFAESYGEVTQCPNIQLRSVIETLIFLYFNIEYDSFSVNVAAMLDIIMDDNPDMSLVHNFFLVGYDFPIQTDINTNKINIGKYGTKIVNNVCKKLPQNFFAACETAKKLTVMMENKKNFVDLFRIVKNNNLIFQFDMVELAKKYLVVFLKDSTRIKLNNGFFTVTKFVKQYKDNYGNTYDTFIYKGMTANSTFDNFSNWDKPSWYGTLNEANFYIARSTTPYALYKFKLIKDIRLFYINVNNLINLIQQYGRIKVIDVYGDIKGWTELIDTCKQYKILNKTITYDTAKVMLEYKNIIDFAFFNTKNYNIIVRNSKYNIDVAFANCLCYTLNNSINMANIKNDVKDQVRIEGYVGDKFLHPSGKYFHTELALCNPYKVLQRVDEKDSIDIKYYNYEQNYLQYWSIIEQWALNKSFESSKSTPIPKNLIEIQKQINQWKSFDVNLTSFNNIKDCVNCQDPKDLIKFTKLFLKRLFYNISQSPYKLIDNVLMRYNLNVYRSNHGSVHHMRSIYLAIKIYQIFKSRNSELFYKVFSSRQHVLAAVLASVFVSLARIDEDRMDGTQGLKLHDNIDIWKTIFPELSKLKDVTDYLSKQKLTFSLTQLSSCFMLMALLKNLLLPTDSLFVEFLGFSNIFYNQDSLKDLLNDSNKQEKLNLLNGLTMLPHYLEHCRGAFSDGIYKKFIINSMDRIKATKDDENDLIYYTISNILKTGERNTWNQKNFNTLRKEDVNICLYTEDSKTMMANESTMNFTKFKNCCKLWGHERYNKREFYTLSTNFKEIWDVLDIETNLIILLT